MCQHGFDMIQAQPLRSSFKLIVSLTFSSLMFEISDLEAWRHVTSFQNF